MWAAHPPTPAFEHAGRLVLARLGARISTLYHGGLGAMCGPYIRAYGLDLRSYVSLAGIWLHIAGEPSSSILPTALDQDTVHIHDLYFLPIMQRLAPAVLDHMALREMSSPRRHVQRFGDAGAVSLLLADLAVGWEYGRRHDDSLDQYVPFTAHFDVDGEPSSAGLMVPDETAWIDVRQVGDLGEVDDSGEVAFNVRAAGRGERVGLRIVTGTEATVGAVRVTLGPVGINFEVPPDAIVQKRTPIGHEIHVSWSVTEISARITIE